jgi:hypothetical protein
MLKTVSIPTDYHSDLVKNHHNADTQSSFSRHSRFVDRGLLHGSGSGFCEGYRFRLPPRAKETMYKYYDLGLSHSFVDENLVPVKK